MRRMLILVFMGLAWRAMAAEPVRNATQPSTTLARSDGGQDSVVGGPVKPATARDDTNSTVITSTQLTFYQHKLQAVFEKNVVVTDNKIKILADCLKVFFTKDNKVDRIEAEGRVKIIRNDLEATGEKATYDIKIGKMQLTGHPLIQRDQDKLTGTTITLWRNSGRILCEPNARLVIASEQNASRSLKE